MTEKKTELVKAASTEMAISDARPDYIKKSHRGVEGITKQDMLIPRLGLAQALSPEVTEGDPRMIPGLKPGDLFNSTTKEALGREVLVQIVRKDKLRAMQWKPIEQGGGMLDPNVSLNDKRCAWGDDGSKPLATVYRDYLALLLPANGKPVEDRLIALSFKSSGIKVAKQLNGLIAFRGADIFAGVYKITTDMSLVPKPHKIFKVANAGWVSELDLKIGEAMFEAVKDLDVVIDREGHSDSDDFNVDELERVGGTHQAAVIDTEDM